MSVGEVERVYQLVSGRHHHLLNLLSISCWAKRSAMSDKTPDPITIPQITIPAPATMSTLPNKQRSPAITSALTSTTMDFEVQFGVPMDTTPLEVLTFDIPTETTPEDLQTWPCFLCGHNFHDRSDASFHFQGYHRIIHTDIVDTMIDSAFSLSDARKSIITMATALYEKFSIWPKALN